jgi:hypothetical protein
MTHTTACNAPGDKDRTAGKHHTTQQTATQSCPRFGARAVCWTHRTGRLHAKQSQQPTNQVDHTDVASVAPWESNTAPQQATASNPRPCRSPPRAPTCQAVAPWTATRQELVASEGVVLKLGCLWAFRRPPACCQPSAFPTPPGPLPHNLGGASDQVVVGSCCGHSHSQRAGLATRSSGFALFGACPTPEWIHARLLWSCWSSGAHTPRRCAHGPHRLPIQNCALCAPRRGTCCRPPSSVPSPNQQPCLPLHLL